MIVPGKHQKIEKSVSKIGGAGGKAFNQPFVEMDGEQAWMIATDAYHLVAIPVTLEEGDTAGAVPIEAIVSSRRKTSDGCIQLGESATVRGLMEFENGEARYSRPTGPSRSVLGLTQPEGEPIVTFGLNAKFLMQVAQALGSDQLTIEVRDPLKPIIVRPMNATGVASIAAVMPVRVRGKS